MWLRELNGECRIQSNKVVWYRKGTKDSIPRPAPPTNHVSIGEKKMYRAKLVAWQEKNKPIDCYVVKTVTGDLIYTLDNPEGEDICEKLA